MKEEGKDTRVNRHITSPSSGGRGTANTGLILGDLNPKPSSILREKKILMATGPGKEKHKKTKKKKKNKHRNLR